MTLTEIINALQSGSGRLIAAALIFGLMWAIKSVPWVELNLLTTPRRRQLAVAFLATAPAITMLAGDVYWVDCLVAFVTIFAEAMGIHVGINVLQGKPVGVVVIGGPDKQADPPATPPMVGGVGMLTIVLLLAGCGAADPSLSLAFAAAGAAVEVEQHVGDIVKQECTDAADKTKTEAELDALQADCMPTIRTLAALRTANLATQAALTAAVAEGNEAKALVAVKGVAAVAEAAATTAAALEK